MAETITLTGFTKKPGLAKSLGISQRTISNLMQRRVIPYYKVGNLVLFKLSEVEAALAKYRVNEVAS